MVQICYGKWTPSHTSKDGFRMVKEVHYYVSNDTNARCSPHLYNMFSCYKGAIWKSKGVSQKCMMFGVMGVVANLSQHELVLTFQYLSLIVFANKLWTCEMIWNCLEIGHGKGEVDGVGAILI